MNDPKSADNGPRRRSVDRASLASLFEDAAPAKKPASGPAPGERLDFSRLTAAPASESGSAPTRTPVDEPVGLSIPPEIETYLPPDLWRRLNPGPGQPAPARGVLINALERMRSVLYLLSTFLPRNLVQEKMRQPYPGRVRGQMLGGTLLFSDVSGFTALAERLAGFGPEGAERLTDTMNEYFAVMLDILAESDGILLKFAGDALLAYFPDPETSSWVGEAAPVDHSASAGAAARAGQRMLQAMGRFAQIATPNGDVRLKMKLGLASGDFLAASVGSSQRMEYIVLGQAIGETMTAEGLTTGGGQIVMNARCAAALPPPRPHLKRLAQGFWLLAEKDELPQAPGGFEIQAQARRARGAIPWNASPQALAAQMEVALRQIQALAPYLAPELAERVVAHASRRSVASQFRPTCVLFCNFNGPELLLQTWGASGAARVTSLLEAYFNAMNGVIARYGGIVSRIDPYSRGSKLLALFGAPVAHEDDPQRAVSAALAMNLELDLLNEAWQRKFARSLPEGWNQPLIQQRIGITSGLTFAGQVGSATRREYTVMGDEVNLAARLMSAAEMGRILISPTVQESIGTAFLVTLRPPVKVKGKSHPVSLAQVEGPQEDSLRQRMRSRGRLIGRSAEVSAWARLLHQAQQGQGGRLDIQGPAGIGKSHLADELLARAERQGMQVYAAQCYSYNQETPLAAWSQLFRQMAGLHALDYTPAAQVEKFGRLLERLAIPPADAPLLAALCGLERRTFEAPAAPRVETDDGDLNRLARHTRRRGSRLDVLERLARGPAQTGPDRAPGQSLSPGEHNRLFEAVSTALTSLSRLAPTVIFFEDAHLLDHDSRQLLCSLGPATQTLRLLLLLAGRPTSEAENLGPVFALKPLAPQETYHLVAHLLIDDLAPVIYEQTRGNPLQVSEIARWFRQTQRIEAGALEQALQTSDFLQKMVLSSLEGLSEIQREIIRAAAVIGPEFQAGEVQALLRDALDPFSLNQHLRALAEKTHFIHSDSGKLDPSYTFQQTLVRDILYSSLSHEQRAGLHSRLAEYLSQPISAQSRAQAWLSAALAAPEPRAERIAYHYEQAGRSWLAARAWLQAARQAWMGQLYDKSGRASARSLENLGRVGSEAGPEQIAALKQMAWVGQGDAAFMGADFPGALSAYESGVAAVGTPTANDLRVRLALARTLQGKPADALSGLQTDPAGQPARPATCGHLYQAAALAWLLWRQGQRSAPTWARRAIELAGPDGPERRPLLLAVLQEYAGDWDMALLDYQQQGCGLLAGLTLLRQGRIQRQRKKSIEAGRAFQQAAVLWTDDPTQNNPLALALFYQAETAWLGRDRETALRTLEQAQARLANCPPGLQTNGRTAIRRAIHSIESAPAATRHIPWPAWEWQIFDDETRAAVLFRSLTESGLME